MAVVQPTKNKVRPELDFLELNQLGFGFYSSPRIMTRILRTVLEKTETMKKDIDSYLDDILVDDSVVSASDIVGHLARYGLIAKEPERVEGGAVLGLQLERDGTVNLVLRKDNEIPKGGVVVEDGAWQRKKDDYPHIIASELNAAIKGGNLALKWRQPEIKIRTDSATVAGWMNSVLTTEKIVRTKGAAEVLVKRRLGINKVDALTRVKKSWLKVKGKHDEKFEVCAAGLLCAKELHGTHHLGVDRSLFLARKVDPNISMEEVRRAVKACIRCQSIDPASSPHSAGELSVRENLRRLAVDVTHHRRGRHLSMVECGPGRFAIWRELKAEIVEEIARVMNEIFLERGSVNEVLLDNSTAFWSEALKDMLDKWNHETLLPGYLSTKRKWNSRTRPSYD
ncbi:uncharacterized protein LOC143020143 [Oratosquilla oratoria]|uniref:uncharacterized protein LOC143020143 n=1 Tax=Oratosquilla oratoria TaxID=337810 RepID=UPI003F762998